MMIIHQGETQLTLRELVLANSFPFASVILDKYLSGSFCICDAFVMMKCDEFGCLYFVKVNTWTLTSVNS